MTARVEYELCCDGTPGMAEFECQTHPIFHKSAKVAREQAAQAGWVTGMRNGKVVDLCPDHQEGFTRWKRARGTCTGCAQERALTTLGDVVAKHAEPGSRFVWCSGSHKPPVAVAGSGAEGGDR